MYQEKTAKKKAVLRVKRLNSCRISRIHVFFVVVVPYDKFVYKLKDYAICYFLKIDFILVVF